MRIAPFTVVVALALGSGAAAQRPVASYNFYEAWPVKWYVPRLDVDSSAPALPSGTYRLEGQRESKRIVGRLRQPGQRDRQLVFHADGCETKEMPQWASRATARAAGEGQVELRIAATNLPSCVLVGTLGLTGGGRGVPGGRPDSGGPDQLFAKPLADLTIRAARPTPKDPLTLDVEIYNFGPGAAAATQVKMFYHHNGQVQTAHAAVPALAAKTNAWVTIGVGKPIKVADSVTARVDDPNQVPETNELNNSFKYK